MDSISKRRKRHGPEQIAKKLRDADAMLNAGQDPAAGLPGPGGQRSHVPPTVEPVRRDEVEGAPATDAGLAKGLHPVSTAQRAGLRGSGRVHGHLPREEPR